MPPLGAASTSEPPSVRGYAVTDLAALLGAVLLWGLVVLGPLDRVGGALLLAVLVLVPLGLRVVDTPTASGRRTPLYHVAVLDHVAAAVLVVFALVGIAAGGLDKGPIEAALVVPYAAVTVVVAAFGAWRVSPPALSVPAAPDGLATLRDRLTR